MFGDVGGDDVCLLVRFDVDLYIVRFTNHSLLEVKVKRLQRASEVDRVVLISLS